MNPINRAAIDYSVRKIQIEIPAFALVHFDPIAIQQKLYLRAGDDGNVQTYLAILKTKIIIPMFLNMRARRKL